MATVAVYCGSLHPKNESIITLAATVGSTLATLGYDIIYGGSAKGLMGVMANAALQAGGKVTGSTPPGMRGKEPPLPQVKMLNCASLTERLAHFRKADAHLALCGGTGTAEEILHMFNAMCFGDWNLSLEEAIPPAPIAMVKDEVESLGKLYGFLQDGAGLGTVNQSLFKSWVKYEELPWLLDWLPRALQSKAAA